MSICNVCCDPYTKETRKMIPCFSCAYEACTRCVKTFLTSAIAEPACMNCHHGWNREFIDMHLSRSWREGELKIHRGAILFDRERSLLPATQPDVEIELLKRQYAERRPALLEMLAKKRDEYYAMDRQVRIEYAYILHGPSEVKKEKRQFIAACPIASCRGFLSTAYKCGTCAKQFCSDCREQKGDAHVCDPDLVATIAEIIKDSRPCPNCGTAISKVSGRDQMYCTQCDTPFSYTSGKVIMGIIHNPHYFERLQKLKVTDAVTGCNGWPDWRTLPKHVRDNRLLQSLIQAAGHTRDITLPGLTPPDNRDLRVRFLLNELDEKKFKQLIQQRDRKWQRELEIRGVLELFVITTLEFFNDRATIGDPMKIAAAFTALQTQLEVTMNAPLKAIGERYGNRVQQFDTATCQFISVYRPPV